MEALLIIGYISFCIAFLRYVIIDYFRLKKRMRNESNKLVDEYARFFEKHPECKNLNEVNEKLRNQEYRSPPNYGEYTRFCEELEKRNESIKEDEKTKKHNI